MTEYAATGSGQVLTDVTLVTGDEMNVNNGGIGDGTQVAGGTLSVEAGGIINDTTLSLGSVDLSGASEANNITVSGGSLVADAQSGSTLGVNNLTINRGGSADIDFNVFVKGVINIDGGTLDSVGGSIQDVSISNNGILNIQYSDIAGQINFRGPGTIYLDPSDFNVAGGDRYYSNAIESFGSNDEIQIQASYFTNPVATLNGTDLVVSTGSGKLHFNIQNPSATNFLAYNDPNTGLLTIVASNLTTSAPTPTPKPTPTLPLTPAPVAPDAVTVSPQVSYEDGVFTLTGTATSAAGVSNVVISAEVNGTRSVLGAAAVAANGDFIFQDPVGAATQGLIEATETDGTGGTASAQADFSLQSGLGREGAAGQQVTYSIDGGSETAVDTFKTDGSQSVQVKAPGQSFTSSFFDTFANAGQPDTTFVFNPNHGLDTVRSFRVAGADHDTLSFNGSDFNNSIADVLNNTHQIAKNICVIVDPVTTDAVRLTSITKQQLATNTADITFHA